ncbi:hypothetical protein MCI89_24075 [Muricomes sp. OA1]|uniref:glycosyl hydrolase n=1 Tax=Lachnospiraceae TaxID=186803 RepID=UPI0015648794|nr:MULTISPECIES: glycosyl hydrolase [Lachnospiraceae]MCH1975422.1 hypothetical protein [Muricomes sp. OA1]
MNILQFNNEKSYLRPLFWQHGEFKEVLIEEIKQMHDNGVGGFIVEARPHPDYLSYGWWRDLDIIIGEAKKRKMEVWIFDDSSYPSGIGAGKMKELYPEYLKTYLAEHHIDVMGPRRNATINVGAWIEASKAEGVHNLLDNQPEELVSVLLAKRRNGTESLEIDTIRDLTDEVHDGKIELHLEEGSWRIFIITITHHGGEEWTRDYVDPLSKNAVAKYIEIIYEEHYKRYAQEFGNTMKGFFSDEPRFGNVAGYENIMWKTGVVYPYTDGLLDMLSKEFGRDIIKYLPLLWSNEDAMCHDIHYCYMNVVSRLFAENFTMQLGDWCRNHNVKYIGHLVEDNGAHARLGYGAGHFFRVMEGMDSAGMDLVYQVWPKHIEGRFTTPFGYLNAEFFYWGISKMTSSCAHLDEKKDGIALCEIFGAYGWQMGLKFMKWLTDHVAVRGINLLVPHAFSPKYPDADCPPHFYANGNNPQWEYFHIWAAYANRVCGLLSKGVHYANAAIVYHAEAEWGGEYQPFEKVVRILAERQIDSDIVPIDYLIDVKRSKIIDEKLCINQERFDVLIIPHMQCITEEFLHTILRFSREKLPVIFIDAYPERIYYQKDTALLSALTESDIQVCEFGTLITYMRKNSMFDVVLEKYDPYFRVYHYEKEQQQIYFVTNEDTEGISTNCVTFPQRGNWTAYDAMENRIYTLEKVDGEDNTYRIELSPYQSLFIIDMNANIGVEQKQIPASPSGYEMMLNDGWSIWLNQKQGKEYIERLTTLRNLSSFDLYPEYSGSISYRKKFNVNPEQIRAFTYLYLGEAYEICSVTLNGKFIGCKIAPPYHFDVTEYIETENLLEIVVVNTFVKEKGNNYFDRSMVQEPSGLLGPVKIISVD